MLNIYPFFVLVNILPALFLNQQNIDTARIFGIPIAYFISIFFGVLLFLFLSIRRQEIFFKDKEFQIIKVLFVLLIYFIVQYYVVDSFASAIVNILALVFYVFIFVFVLVASRSFSERCLNKIVGRCNCVFVFGILLGSVKYISGIAPNANFFVFLNRNSTALVVLLFYSLYSFYNKDRKVFLYVSLINFLFFILLESRAGIIGFVLVNGILFVRFRLENFLIVAFTIFVSVAALSSKFGHEIEKRLDEAFDSIGVLISRDTLSSDQNDYRRVTLIYSGLDILGENFLWGTGIGSKNYIRYFDTSKYKTKPGQPHNFFLSYPSQMGVFGFSIFLILLYLCFSRVFNKGGSSGKAFILGMVFYLTFNEYILLPEVWILSAFFCAMIDKRKSTYE